MLSEEVRRVVITGHANEHTILLSPLDTLCFCSDVCLPWFLFYDYDIDGDRLKLALQTTAYKYPHLCGRVLSKADGVPVLKLDGDVHGFPYIEARSELTIAEAIKKAGQLEFSTADFPSNPPPPFYVESMDVDAVKQGEEPVIKVKLTHFSDGCAIGVTASHLVVDGQRLSEFIRDLSFAYRGLPVEARDLSRDYMWPDHLVKYYPFLDQNLGQRPRRLPIKQPAIPPAVFPDETRHMESLYFSKGTLEEMKATVHRYLPEGEFVSSNDVIVAFYWMLWCELKSTASTVESPEELEMDGTSFTFCIECVINGIDIIPRNYSGNAVVNELMTISEKLRNKTFAGTMAQLAQLTRRRLETARADPSVAASNFLEIYDMVTQHIVPEQGGSFRGALSNISKSPGVNADFGHGRSVMLIPLPSLPIRNNLSLAGPTPCADGGVIVHATFLSTELAKLRSSVVRKFCAPGMKLFYSEITLDDLRTSLGNTYRC